MNLCSLEVNLFLSSIGKDKLDESTRKVKLREEIDLSEYEDMLDEC